MSYSINVVFTSPDGPDITFSDVITPDDWSCANYWDDLGDCISCLIGFAEKKLSKIFPSGNSYTLSAVHSVYLGDDEE